MRLLKKILLATVFIVLLISCKNKEETQATTTYIGGQIINPILDYVIFSRGNQVLDTVTLDNNNVFAYTTEKIEKGLYFIKHGESQIFFIEPGDSLLIHLNTIDFDESIAYSGKGGEQNNLLIDLYLMNEIENNNLLNWYTLTSAEFESKIDSLKTLKIELYQNFISDNKTSEEFKQVAQANIKYDYFSKKEMYASANKNNPDKFDKDYFDYREQIEFDLDELKFYYPYYRFLNRFFENKVCSKFDKGIKIDHNSYDFNIQKIKLIDSMVFSEALKNSLLRYNAMWYLLNAKDSDEETRYFELFSKLNTDQKNFEDVKKVFDATVKLTAGNPIPNAVLVNTDNEVNYLHDLIKTPTVVFFWSGNLASKYKNLHNRAAELKSKYPEYDFFGINTDSHFKKWREIVKKSNYDSNTEFQLENLSEARTQFVLNALNKVIIVDENGIILEGKTNLFNKNFEEQLLGFLNR